MASHIFAKFDTFEGESEEQFHEGWCEILELNQDIESEAMPHQSNTQRGKRAKKVKHGEIEIKKLVDRASTRLMRACWDGDTLETVTIECYRAGLGVRKDRNYSHPPIKFFSIELKSVIIKGFDYTAGAGDLIAETINLIYAKATYKYREMYKETGRAAGIMTASSSVGAANRDD